MGTKSQLFAVLNDDAKVMKTFSVVEEALAYFEREKAASVVRTKTQRNPGQSACLEEIAKAAR